VGYLADPATSRGLRKRDIVLIDARMSSNSNSWPDPGDDTTPLLPTSPPVIRGYRIEGMIGEGGFGQVWRGFREDGSVVAIKVLHLELIRSNDALTRFERELEAIERLNHRNVVRALDHGTLQDGRPFLVLEFIEGPSLREVIHERGLLRPSEMLEIVEPLADALATAHAVGLVHRDVKASNVILGHDALGPRPVLLDFGLVKLLDHDGPSLTSSRSMLGTPAAMAPEQMRGLPVDARTDVYALGLLVYHMLAGTQAFGGGPGVVQSYLQAHGPRPRPSAQADLDPAIDEPVLRALQQEPEARFAGTRELVAALRAVIRPACAGVQEVVALYAEGEPSQVDAVASVISAVGMTVALTAPDSVLAVALLSGFDRGTVVDRLRTIEGARIALGISRAAIAGAAVDGAALDVEGWAPYPLQVGVWIADALK
jgi:serine/threonine-protein kinase